MAVARERAARETQGDAEDWVAAVAVDANGDLIFPVVAIASIVSLRRLPNLRWCGLSRDKRGPWYGPDPRVWGLATILYEGRPATKVLVPRRYQWWSRLVLRCSVATFLRAFRGSG